MMFLSSCGRPEIRSGSGLGRAGLHAARLMAGLAVGLIVLTGSAHAQAQAPAKGRKGKAAAAEADAAE